MVGGAVAWEAVGVVAAAAHSLLEGVAHNLSPSVGGTAVGRWEQDQTAWGVQEEEEGKDPCTWVEVVGVVSSVGHRLPRRQV